MSKKLGAQTAYDVFNEAIEGLEIKPGMTADEIVSRITDRVFPSLPEGNMEYDHESSKFLAAYDILIDPDKKQIYDILLQRNGSDTKNVFYSQEEDNKEVLVANIEIELIFEKEIDRVTLFKIYNAISGEPEMALDMALKAGTPELKAAENYSFGPFDQVDRQADLLAEYSKVFEYYSSILSRLDQAKAKALQLTALYLSSDDSIKGEINIHIDEYNRLPEEGRMGLDALDMPRFIVESKMDKEKVESIISGTLEPELQAAPANLIVEAAQEVIREGDLDDKSVNPNEVTSFILDDEEVPREENEAEVEQDKSKGALPAFKMRQPVNGEWQENWKGGLDIHKVADKLTDSQLIKVIPNFRKEAGKLGADFAKFGPDDIKLRKKDGKLVMEFNFGNIKGDKETIAKRIADLVELMPDKHKPNIDVYDDNALILKFNDPKADLPGALAYYNAIALSRQVTKSKELGQGQVRGGSTAKQGAA